MIVIRAVGLLIQVINTAVWVCRSSFSKKWHFIQWNIGNLSLLLALPLFGCKSESQLLMESLDFISVTAQLGIFAYFVALTPLHSIITLFTVVIVQISIFCSQNFAKNLSAFNVFVVIN